MTLDRRGFLAAGAAAAAGGLVASFGVTGDALALGPGGGTGVRWERAPCRFCGTGCTLEVGVRGGRAVAVRGDKDAQNRGLLCAKGYHAALALYGADRLTTPQVRRGGRLQSVSWDEAIALVAGRAMADPAGFAVYGSGQWTIPEGVAFQKFVRGGLGSNLIEANARLCMSSAVTGFLAVYGVDEPASCYEDLDAADVVICWGNNLAEMHPVLFSRVLDRRNRGQAVTLVDVATRRTRTTEYAQHAVTFRPQTDMALLLGIAWVLVETGAVDQEFVRGHVAFKVPADPADREGKVLTFDEYRALLRPWDPVSVSRVSGVPAAEVRRLASYFARKETKVVSLWCMGMNQHTRGTATNTMVHAVHLLSGHFGKPGDGPMSLTGQPSACGTVREVGTLAHALPGGRVVSREEHRRQIEDAWNLAPGRIPAKPGPATVEMWERFTRPAAKGGDVHTVWVQVTNPATTLPDLSRFFGEGRKDPGKLLVVSDVYPTETTRIADVVLPSAMWIEKAGAYGNTERRTQAWRRTVAPPGQARDDTWQVIAVARAMFDRGFVGMRDRDGQFLFRQRAASGGDVPSWRWDSYRSDEVARGLYEDYRPLTRLKHKDVAPWDELLTRPGLRWPVHRGADGAWKETRRRFVPGEDPNAKPGKRVDFYHAPGGDGRAVVWFHPYEPPPEAPDREWPFWLTTGRVLEHWHTGTMTMRVPQLRAAMPGAYAELHPDDARALGVESGEAVAVSTRRGELVLRAWVGGRAQPPRGTVFVPFFDESHAINRLTLGAIDPISKQPDYKKCAARVRKVERA